jgi:hypothetical protein
VTIIVRDRAQEDKVVKIIEPLDTVNLTYDFENNDGRLAFVKTNWPNYNGVQVNQIHKLYYGDYLNSLDETENVLQRVRQTTDIGDLVLEYAKVIRSCKQCPVYDELEDELEIMATQNQKGGSTT